MAPCWQEFSYRGEISRSVGSVVKDYCGFFISLKVVVSLSVFASQTVNLVAKLELPSPLPLH